MLFKMKKYPTAGRPKKDTKQFTVRCLPSKIELVRKVAEIDFEHNNGFVAVIIDGTLTEILNENDFKLKYGTRL
jgi:hypothetical protein